MVTALVPQAFDWLAPSPLWDLAEGGHRRAEFFQPALVELAGPTFMADWLATARAPGAPIRDVVMTPDATDVMKLFLPVHGRFYLVAASLCCRLPGFPDKVVDGGDAESVFFVLRRLVDGKELAWVEQGREHRWVPTDETPRRLIDGEVRQPMATAGAGSGRTLAFGYIPVASGETYREAATALAAEGKPPPDLRVEELGSRFTEPLTGPTAPGSTAPDPKLAAINLTPAKQSRAVSVYLLLDAYEFFERELPDVAATIRGEPGAALEEPVAAKTALLDHLASIAMVGPTNLKAALALVAAKRAILDAEGGVEDKDQLAGLGFGEGYDFKANSLSTSLLVALLDKVADALPGDPPPVELPKLSPRADAEYVLRLVYERPQCSPVQQVVSMPCHAFRIAPFFDPDAPWPPVRIPMPADVSVAGMRKFSKNVSFMLSESLQKKVNSITGKERDMMKNTDPLPDGSGVAFICSFSIQIVFIVALILLMMFVVILNIAFWWMAFFKICFPIPKGLAPK
jgi:hypothetical protein